MFPCLLYRRPMWGRLVMSGLPGDAPVNSGRVGRSRQVAPRAICSGYSFLQGSRRLEDICENLDHGIDPNSTVVVRRYRARNTYAQATLPAACMHAHTRPKVTLKTSETMNKSARTKRNGELPSAATSTRMKNQNQ